MVFNELSVKPELVEPGRSNVSSRQTIDCFVSFLHHMRKRDMLDEIITLSDIHAFYVSEGYGVNEWLSDSGVNRTHKQFLQLMRNKSWRYIESGDYADCEFTVAVANEIHKALGCVIASQNEYPVISVETSDLWTRPEIKGEYVSLDEDGNIHSKERSVRNLSGSMDISTIETEFRATVYKRVSSGQDLWELREDLYPNLIFCESVKDQLHKDPEKYHILKIMEKLERLQKYFAEYGGAYDPKVLGMGARSESESVKSDNSLKNMRKFRKPTGEEAYFFDHIGFSGKFSAGRIHFLPQNDVKICYIGYIGRHLDTKKY